MQVKPIRHYNDPGFPTRGVLDERPELLRLVPRRWQGNPAVIAALTGMCVLMAGFRASADDARDKSSIPRFAPIFQHGDGRGSFGCVSTSPPVLLSEGEARTVIIEEARRLGLDFAASSVVVPDVDMSGRAAYPSTNPASAIEPNPHSIAIDGTDIKRKISFEYVSEKDLDSWRRPPHATTSSKPGPDGSVAITLTDTEIVSTAQSVDTKGTAERLRLGLSQAKTDGTFAVFYDPCTRWSDVKAQLGVNCDAGKNISAQAREVSRQELRKQVRDFVAWLKAQGVI